MSRRGYFVYEIRVPMGKKVVDEGSVTRSVTKRKTPITRSRWRVAGLSEEEVDQLTHLPLCPRALEGFRVISVDLVSLVAGMKFCGDFEEHVQSMANEASATPTILFIDKLHTLIGAGGGDGGMNAANL